MTSLDIQTTDDLISYINENPLEATFEMANVECEGVCRLTKLDWNFDTVKAIEVELITLNGIPARWLDRGTVRLAEYKLAYHEDILSEVRSTVQYVVDIKSEYRGDYTGGDAIDAAYDAAQDKRRIA